MPFQAVADKVPKGAGFSTLTELAASAEARGATARPSTSRPNDLSKGRRRMGVEKVLGDTVRFEPVQ
jgi:hypothetical protein